MLGWIEGIGKHGINAMSFDVLLGFLGVRTELNYLSLLKMKKEHLIDHVIKALVLNVGTANRKATPAKAKPLVEDTDQEVAHVDFSYFIVVSILLYLSQHSFTDISDDINCATHNMFCPRHSHEQPLKELEGTRRLHIQGAHSQLVILLKD